MHVPIEHHLTSFFQVLVIANHSFCHNLSFRFPNWKCESIFNICTFNGIKKAQFEQGFLFALLFQGFKTLARSTWGSVETHFLALLHTWGTMYESHDYLVAHFTFHALILFASPSSQLGHKYTSRSPRLFFCVKFYIILKMKTVKVSNFTRN